MSGADVDACCVPGEDRARRRARAEHLHRAMRLELLTVGWNLLEGAVAVTAAAVSGSIALMGFGIDSFVESASGSVLIWRLRAEQGGATSEEQIERLEGRAGRLVGASLVALALYVALDAAHMLWTGDRPEFSTVGVVLTAVSAAVMLWLAKAKRRVAGELQSRALAADAFQTTACWWLSIATLVGVGLNGLFGWWWADPAAALVIAALVGKEGREAWEGRSDCCP